MIGLAAARAAYSGKALVPQLEFGWDQYSTRRSRYLTYDNYHNNTAYATINSQASALKLDNKLYKFIRGIYNPVTRFNNLNVSYIAGGEIDMDALTIGSIPIITDNEAIRTALLKVLEWSRWGENKALYVETGSNKGDTYIKVIDDRKRRQARFELLSPEFVRDVLFDEVGNIKEIIIEYERDEEPNIQNAKPGALGQVLSRKGKSTYLYTEKITKEKFETFKDGEPFGYYENDSGKLVSEWDNEYGFIPIVHQTHAAPGMGLKFGKNGYYNTLPKINEINDQASIISDKIRQILQPILYAEGVTQQSQIETATDEKDQVSVLFGPSGSKLTPVTIDLNISAALENLNNMIKELEGDLPVLSLQHVREMGGNLSGTAIENLYGDAIMDIKQRRGRYDAAFVRAGQMAISIGGYNAYDGFEGFDLSSYEAGNLQFYVKDRPVINDTLSVNEHITALGTIGNLSAPLQKLALKKLDYSEDDIQEVVDATEQAAMNQIDQFAKSAFGDMGSNTDTNGGSTALGAGQGDKKPLQLPEKVPA